MQTKNGDKAYKYQHGDEEVAEEEVIHRMPAYIGQRRALHIYDSFKGDFVTPAEFSHRERIAKEKADFDAAVQRLLHSGHLFDHVVLFVAPKSNKGAADTAS